MAMTDERLAVESLEKLFRCYPNRIKTEPEYKIALVSLLIGKPDDIVSMMADPELGVVAEFTYWPTVADVKKWLYRKIDEKSRRGEREDRLLGDSPHRSEHDRDELKYNPSTGQWAQPEKPWEPPTEEERERVARVVASVKANMAAKAEVFTGKKTLVWKQRHDPDALIAALNNRLT